jgi:hypothetical protein
MGILTVEVLILIALSDAQNQYRGANPASTNMTLTCYDSTALGILPASPTLPS